MVERKRFVSYGGPCTRKCDVDKATLVCRSCGLYFKEVVR